VIHHIFCGDCAADHARPHLTRELAGKVHVWKDSSAVGPCSVDPAAHRRLRSAWWHVALAEIQHPGDFPRPFVAWFGPDPWEQVALLELLAGAGHHATFVPLDCNVTDIDPGDFPAWYAARRPTPDPIVLGRLWTDFCADDPSRDSGLLALARSVALPHLASAIGRVLADRRDHLTERRVRDLVANGTHDLPRLMRALAALEAPHHGAWYGDAIVARLRDAALRV
jgi:hypothetical protein